MQPNIVVVPDMAAVDLTALVEKELKLTYLDSDYRQWNYYIGVDKTVISGRGKRFESLIWKPELKPNETISSGVVCKHFKGLGGFYGHAGAFTEWRRVCGLNGYHTTILDDNSCVRFAGGRLCVPYSDFRGADRKLCLGRLGGGWSGGWSFVAFREVA